MPINWAKWGKYVMTSKSQTFSHLASANLSHKVLSHMTTTLSFSSFSRTVCGMHLSSTLRVPSHMVLIQWFFNTVFHYKCSRGATGHIIFWPYTYTKDHYLSSISQIQSIFPCVYSVLNQRWLQSAVGKRKWYTGCSRVRHCYSCYMSVSPWTLFLCLWWASVASVPWLN